MPCLRRHLTIVGGELFQEKTVDRLNQYGQCRVRRVFLEKVERSRSGIAAKRLQEVCGLTVTTRSLLKHVNQETELAKQAVVVEAGCCRMSKGQITNDRNEAEQLEERIRVGIGDMGFQTRKLGLIVVPDVSCQRCDEPCRGNGYLLEIEIIYSKLRVLDLNIAVDDRHILFCDTFQRDVFRNVQGV